MRNATDRVIFYSRRKGRADQRSNKGHLTIKTQAFVTRVVFEDGTPPWTIGVEARLGEHLFQADPKFSASASFETVQFNCQREVILAGGTFNSPQLLMLSGIGPEDQLNKLGLRCISNLPGVGQNLQDRYEVAIIHQMREDFGLLKNVTLDVANPDPDLQKWIADKKGAYTTNGAVLGVFLRSDPMLSEPDVFVFAVPGDFRGYKKGYSKEALTKKNVLNWENLKASPRSRRNRYHRIDESLRRSEVGATIFEKLRFQGADLKALVHGVRYVEESRNTSNIRFTPASIRPPSRTWTTKHSRSGFGLGRGVITPAALAG
jgi:choline dehydrogenase